MANSQCGEIATGTAGASVHRFFVWTSGNGYIDGNMSTGYPSAGGDVHGVILDGVHSVLSFGVNIPLYAVPGMPARVEAGGAFGVGQLLETDATGRAVAHGTGIVVARALQSAAGAGSVVGVVFTSGR